MNLTPTREQVAQAAAEYAVREFTQFDSWFSHEKEFAGVLLAEPTFVCAADYAIKKVVEMMRFNAGMQGYAAQRGVGARGTAAVVGAVVGEWLAGGTTIDQQLETW